MATIEAEPPRQHEDDRRILLRNVRWQTYEMLLADVSDRRLFLTYHRGELEIRSPSPEHERYRYLIGKLIDLLAFELRIRIDALGSTTFRREDLEHGLEPDACYYIQNEAAIRNKAVVDLTCDPPPDLAIEVDITSSSSGRLEIYAALGVPEVWRFDGDSLRVYVLRDGRYVVDESSACFPFLPMSGFAHFLEKDPKLDQTSWLAMFAAWVHEEVAPRYQEWSERQGAR
jgi:Uma2 family endonuclease